MYGEVLLDALLDTLKIFPYLFIAYILIEVFSYFFSDRLSNGIISRWAPLVGSFLGIIPQCGFSVLTAELYTRRFVTIGTLFAVFLATSDEAILILISEPNGLSALLPVILVKLVSAIIFGTIIDVIFSKRNRVLMNQAEEELKEEELSNVQDDASMSCSCMACNTQNKWKMFLLSPFLHSLKILAFILVINIAFGTVVYFIGEENLASFIESSTAFAPIFSALVGLIPNCASSVIITELYLNGMSFSALVAGLCANVGIASTILFRRLHIKECLIILGSLLLISIAIGYLIMLIGVAP